MHNIDVSTLTTVALFRLGDIRGCRSQDNNQSVQIKFKVGHEAKSSTVVLSNWD